MYYGSEDVFISYCSKNQEVAEKIKEILEAPPRSVSCWMANDVTITSGDDFRARIVDAIRRCKVFLFILSKDSMASHWCSLELSFAILENKKIYSIQIDNSPLDNLCAFKLGCAQISNATENFDAAVESVAINVKSGRDSVLEREKNQLSQNRKYNLSGYLFSYLCKKILGLAILVSLIVVFVFANRQGGLLKLLNSAESDIENFSLLMSFLSIFIYCLFPYFIISPILAYHRKKIVDGSNMDNPSAHYSRYWILRIEPIHLIFHKKQALAFLERSAELGYTKAIKRLEQIKANP